MNQFITYTLVSAWLFLTGENAIKPVTWTFTSSSIAAVVCDGESLSILKKDGADLKALALISLPNGNMLIGGAENNASLLLELNPDGEVVWAGTVDILSGQSEAIIGLIKDSEGKIICLGRDANAIINSYLVKFNPISKSIEWTTLSTNPDHMFWDVIAQGGFDPYIVSGLVRYSPSPGLGGDACLRSIDRTTGAITSDLTSNYNLGSAEHFGSAELYESYLYTIGRYNSAGGGFEKMRIAVSKLDLNGNEIWTRLLIHPESSSARVYGADLIVKNETIFFIGNGDPNGISTTITKSYLGRIDLDGNLMWAKEFSMDGISKPVFVSIYETNDGLLISCADGVAGSKTGFVHVDNNGNILSSGQLGSIVDFTTGLDNFLVSETEFCAIYSTSQYTSESAIAFVHHPLAAVDADGCSDFGEFVVTSKDIPTPANESYNLIEYSHSSPFSNPSLTFAETDITDTLQCVCEEICDNFIDDDNDGLIDCDDPDLQDNCCCLTQTSPDTIITSTGESVVLKPDIDPNTVIVSYLWTPTDGLSCTSCPDPTVNITSSTLYSVQITDSSGCTYTDEFLVLIVSDCRTGVYIPNIFSPNGDGINDTFFIQGVSNIGEFVGLRIFNKWGGIVYDTDDPFFHWDGQYNGKSASAGVYVYTLEIICHDGNQVVLSGDITLLN